MAYAKPNKTSTTPRPPARRRGRAIDIAGPQNPTVNIIEATGTWNFACRIWLAFDPPTSLSPNWIDISGFVQQDNPISINYGRADGLSDVNNATCTLTVDNSDQRFSPANPAGPWFGQIHKGNWLKIEIFPPSGIVSERFKGFINSLPNQWAGPEQFGQITASDRFEKLGQAPALISSIQHEVMTDPNLAGSILGYWNLHEAAVNIGSTITFGDTSGQGAAHLTAASGGGVPVGIGFGASNVDGPGFDGTRAPSFVPVTSAQGTYLTAPIVSPTNGTWNLATGAYSGLYGTLELWFQIPVLVPNGSYQVIGAVIDPATNFGYTLVVTSHYLVVSPAGTNFANTAFYQMNFQTYPFTVDDGQWHHLVVGVAATNGGGGWASMVAIVDGVWSGTFAEQNISGGTTSGNFTQLLLGGGYNPAGTPGAVFFGQVNIAEVAWYWSDLWNQVPANGRPPDALTHYHAGTNGFTGESTDSRIARLARYTGVPAPQTALSFDSFNTAGHFSRSTLGQVQSYVPATTPWLNLAPGAHRVATQSIAGRKALDVMREAARTEGMPVFINKSGYLTLQNSTIRQNTSPAWSVNALDLDVTTQVADDFAYTTNQVTVTPNGQAAQTVIGLPGSVGQLSQAKYGVYDGSQATASLNAVEARSLGLGVIQLRADPAPRPAPLAIEVATAALLPGYGSAWYDAVLATDISTPIRVTNAPAAIGGGNYDCLVEGWSETITAGNHLLAFNVSPIQGPTYQLDDVVLGHIDTDGSTLSLSILGSDLSFQVATTNPASPIWTTSGTDFPFDVNIGGERMTISSITGASSPQFFNVALRAVNGAQIPLGADGTFETGVAGWTATGGTFAASTAQAHSGTRSGLMTTTGTPTQTFVRTPLIPVTPGMPIAATLWALTASGAPNTLCVIDFYDATQTYQSTFASTAVSTPATWTALQAVTTVPVGIAYAAIGPTVNGSPAAGTAIYVDDVSLTSPPSHAAGTPVSLWQPLTLAY